MIKVIRHPKPYQLYCFLLLINLVAIAVQFKNPSGRALTKNWFFDAAITVGNAISQPIHSIGETVSSFSTLRKMQEENSRLRSELDRLKFEQSLVGERLARATRLEQMLNFLSSFQREGLVTEVTSRGFQLWDQEIIIRGGTRDGLGPDLPVFGPEGVVGRIIHSGLHYSDTALLTNGGFAMAGIIQEKNIRGIIHGTGGELLKFDYVTMSAFVSPGDRIVSSGDDGIFPPDFSVGYVVDVKREGHVFQNIAVRPMADIQNLRTVFVLKNAGDKH